MTWLTGRDGRVRWVWLPALAVVFMASQLVFALPLLTLFALVARDAGVFRRHARILRATLPVLINGTSAEMAGVTAKIWSGGFDQPAS